MGDMADMHIEDGLVADLFEEYTPLMGLLCRCGHTESEHKSLDSRPFGKWNCTYCQCKEYEKL